MIRGLLKNYIYVKIRHQFKKNIHFCTMCISELVWWRGICRSTQKFNPNAHLSSSHIQRYEHIDLDRALLIKFCIEVNMYFSLLTKHPFTSFFPRQPAAGCIPEIHFCYCPLTTEIEAGKRKFCCTGSSDVAYKDISTVANRCKCCIRINVHHFQI